MPRRRTRRGDPALSPRGEARARALAALLRDAGVTAVWATELRRTQLTAQPLAKARQLPVRVHAAGDSAGLVEEIRKQQPRGRVLVVGHSNTLPEIAAALRGAREDPARGRRVRRALRRHPGAGGSAPAAAAPARAAVITAAGAPPRDSCRSPSPAALPCAARPAPPSPPRPPRRRADRRRTRTRTDWPGWGATPAGSG